MREVERLDRGLALPFEILSEIPDLGSDTPDTRGGDVRFYEQAIQVADCMRDARDETLVRQRPGSVHVEGYRVA